MSRFSAISALVAVLAMLQVSSAQIQYPVTFEAMLDSTNVIGVPAVMSKATGTAYIRFTSSDSAVAGFAVTNLIKASAMHIHNGTAIQSGGVLHTIFFPILGQDQQFISGKFRSSAMFTPAAGLFEACMNSAVYFNVHTLNYPGGEIRGQFEPIQYPVTFEAMLDSTNVIGEPAVMSKATGTAYIRFTSSNSAVAGFAVKNLIKASAMHIHNGTAIQSGGVLHTIFFPILGQDQQFISGNFRSFAEFTPVAGLFEACMDSAVYFNVHTMEYPGGEIRGQFEPLE
jgi:adenosine/AMP kinase